MAELKKIGHNINLKHFVIHRIIKDAGTRGATLKLRDNVLNTTEKEKVFIGRVTNSYHKKSCPTYGIFDELSDKNKFQTNLSKFVDSEILFLDFTKEAMDHYKDSIKDVAPASGGFVVFAYYENTDKKNNYLLVLTLNNKDGYAFNDKDLTIENIKDIDLSKIDVASLINVSKWKNIESESDIDSKTYLSFVKGNKDVSVYFMTFIGCADKTTSSVASKRLMSTLDEYCNYKQFDQKKTVEIKNTVTQYGLDCIKEKRAIMLSYISMLIDGENPDDFKEFASEEEHGVNEIISGDNTVFKSNRVTKYKTNDLLVEFNNMLLVQKKIIYNKKNKTLTINNIDLNI